MDEPILIKAKAIEQRASDGCVTVEVDTVTGKLQMFVYPEQLIAERKGKWIPSKYGDDTWHTCTSCGCDDKYIDIVKRPNGTIGRLESIRNFCPNCGAKMEVDA